MYTCIRMMVCYKYPIFPNKITQWKLAENLDACRWLYNRLLQDLGEAKEKDIKLKTYDTQNMIPSLKLENLKTEPGLLQSSSDGELCSLVQHQRARSG